ncbi:MAG: FeoA family protein [Saprospiraceae bacterium]
MNSPLSKLKVGNQGKIAYFMDDAIAGKLTTMGVLPGSVVNVIRKAPFKGGIYLKIDGGNIVLRDREAAAIILSV